MDCKIVPIVHWIERYVIEHATGSSWLEHSEMLRDRKMTGHPGDYICGAIMCPSPDNWSFACGWWQGLIRSNGGILLRCPQCRHGRLQKTKPLADIWFSAANPAVELANAQVEGRQWEISSDLQSVPTFERMAELKTLSFKCGLPSWAVSAISSEITRYGLLFTVINTDETLIRLAGTCVSLGQRQNIYLRSVHLKKSFYFTQKNE